MLDLPAVQLQWRSSADDWRFHDSWEVESLTETWSLGYQYLWHPRVLSAAPEQPTPHHNHPKYFNFIQTAPSEF